MGEVDTCGNHAHIYMLELKCDQSMSYIQLVSRAKKEIKFVRICQLSNLVVCHDTDKWIFKGCPLAQRFELKTEVTVA